METTFLTTFTRASNLRALLNQPDLLPASLTSLITKVMNTEPMRNESDFLPSTTGLSYQPFLSDHLLRLLVAQINLLGPPNHITSDQHHQLTPARQNLFHPINGKHKPLKRYRRENITYSTFKENSRNSLVKLDATHFPACQQFGFIDSIFEHSYISADQVRKVHTWFAIKPLPDIPSHLTNPFREINSPAMQVDLRLPPDDNPTCTILAQVHSIETLCAWTRYKPGEVHVQLKTPTIGLVSLNKD